jgi:Ca2+-binding EF-hand superfamily protein
MPLSALILPILASVAQVAEPPITVTGRPWAPFISPMGEPFRARTAGDDTLARWFHQADRNQDGVLAPDEMQADADRFFATLDTDHNGAIEPEELVQYEWELAPEIQVGSKWKRVRPAVPSEKASDGERRRGNGERRRDGGNQAYDSRTSDGLEHGLQGAARYTLLNIPEPVAAADADFNRAVTLGEFRRAATYRFQLLDTKRQGKLSLQDLAALLPPPPKEARRVKRRKDAVDTRVGLPLPQED